MSNIDTKVKNIRIEEFKELLESGHSLTKNMIDLQESKLKILTEYLEYEEALTTDKQSAERIRKILIDLGVWEQKVDL